MNKIKDFLSTTLGAFGGILYLFILFAFVAFVFFTPLNLLGAPWWITFLICLAYVSLGDEITAVISAVCWIIAIPKIISLAFGWQFFYCIIAAGIFSWAYVIPAILWILGTILDTLLNKRG